MTDMMTRVRAVTARAPRMPWRPAPATAPPAYVKCAGCGRGGRPDQQVPDPAQFVNKLGSSTGIVGNAAVVPAKTPDEGAALRLTDAAPVWCAPCGAWYHAIGCYSLHRHE